MPDSVRPRLCFVIPVRNAAGPLERCLASIEAARRGDPTVRVVVVDNGSEDGSAGVARRVGARVIVEPHLSIGALRNAGVRSGDDEIVAFVDADHEIAPEWIDSCRRALSQQDVGAAGRLCDAPRPGTWVQRAYDCLR